MSHLAYKSYEGFGTEVLKTYGFSQSVKVGDQVYISGQGGWETKNPEKYGNTQEEQIDQAFKNIDIALRDVGASFDNVFKIHSYHLPINEGALGQMKINFDKWMPKHRPLWTALEVPALGLPEMLIEIEVIAHVPSK